MKDLAQRFGISVQTVRRIFEEFPGVLVVGERRTTKGKRRYRTLLVPESAVKKAMKLLG